MDQPTFTLSLYAWGLTRPEITHPWADGLMVADLDYWEQVRATHGAERPSVRTLARAWGVAKSVAYRRIRKYDGADDTSETIDNGGTRERA